MRVQKNCLPRPWQIEREATREVWKYCLEWKKKSVNGRQTFTEACAENKKTSALNNRTGISRFNDKAVSVRSAGGGAAADKARKPIVVIVPHNTMRWVIIFFDVTLLVFGRSVFPFSRGRGRPSGRVTVKLVAWWHLRESCACIACLYFHIEWNRIIAFQVDGESQTGRRPRRVSWSLCRRWVRGASRSLSALSRRTPRHLSVAPSATLLPRHPTASQIDWPCHGRKPIVTIMSLLWKQIFFAKINRTASTVYGEFVFFCILVAHTRAPFSRSPMPAVSTLPPPATHRFPSNVIADVSPKWTT